MRIGRYFICLLFTSLIVESLSAQKIDKVYLQNGDVLTGEIKNLSLAILKFDMDGPGIIDIKWEYVKSINSKRIFEIVFRSGAIVVNALDSSFFQQNLVHLNDIVELATIKNKFLKRLKGNFSVGSSYTKSSEIFQINFSGTVDYRIPKVEVSLSTTSYYTVNGKDSSTIKEQDIGLTGLRYFGEHYLAGGQFRWQKNSELGLKNRFSLSALAGKAFITDNHNRLISSGGLSYSKEQAFESNSYTTNVDGVITVEYKLFYYSSPKRNIDSYVNSYPSITNWGRVRLEFGVNTSIEVFKDFIVGVNFYDKFDSRPPEGATSKNDYGLSFTLGYKFGQ